MNSQYFAGTSIQITVDKGSETGYMQNMHTALRYVLDPCYYYDSRSILIAGI